MIALKIHRHKNPATIHSVIHVTWETGGIFIYLQLKHVFTFFVLEGCQYDCFPTDLIIKGENHSEWEVEKRNGSTAFFSAGSPSGRHKSGDVTNAVNVLACLQYGLFWASQANRCFAACLLTYTFQRFVVRSNLNFLSRLVFLYCFVW